METFFKENNAQNTTELQGFVFAKEENMGCNMVPPGPNMVTKFGKRSHTKNKVNLTHID